MNKLQMDVKKGFTIIKINMVLTIIMGIIGQFVSKLYPSLVQPYDNVSLILSTALPIYGAYKLKGLNSEMRSFYTWVLINGVSSIIVILVGNIETFFNKYVYLNESFNWKLIAVVILVFLISIVVGIYMHMKFRNGVKLWVDESGDDYYEYLKILADKYFKRKLIVILGTPTMLLISFLIMMINPFVLMNIVLLMSLAFLVYGIYDFIKSYIFYGECEKATSKLIGVMQGEN